MKRLALILGLGLLACVAGYFGAYVLHAGSAAGAMRSGTAPELAWLKEEFHLSDAEFDRIAKLHAAYKSHCAEMCRRIDTANAEVKEALAKSDHVTPEIEQKLAAAEQLRVECHTAMLQHFYAVSQSMPPEQGRRYLEWVEDQIFPSESHMDMSGTNGAHPH